MLPGHEVRCHHWARTHDRALVEATDLTVTFPVARRDIPRRASIALRAVDRLSLAIAPGEVLGLVGESGSGKTTTGRAILRLLRAIRRR